MRWEVADDETLPRASSPAARRSPKRPGRTASTPSRSASSRGRWYWYRFSALGEQSAAGRTRTAPRRRCRSDAAPRRRELPALRRRPLRRLAPRRRREPRPRALPRRLHLRVAVSGPSAIRRHEGTVARTLAEYRARYATYKSDPLLQAAHARRALADGLGRPRGRQRLRQPAGPGPRAGLRDPARRRLPAYWEHMPFPKSARPRGPDMRIVGRLDWGAWRASTCSTTASTAIRRPARKPGRGGSNTCPLADCPALADPQRTPARRRAGALARRRLGHWRGPGTCSRQQTLMARFAWDDPAARRRRLLDRRLGRLRAGAQAPARRRRRAHGAGRRRPRRRRAQQLRRRPQGRLRRPARAGRRQRVLRHLDLEPVAGPVAHRCGARLQPARPLRPRRPARLR